MPRYLRTEVQLVNPRADASRLGFLKKLVDKLEAVAESVLTNYGCGGKRKLPEGSMVLVTAPVEVPRADIGLEYLVYVKRFGPPVNGIFEEEKLNIIRGEIS